MTALVPVFPQTEGGTPSAVLPPPARPIKEDEEPPPRSTPDELLSTYFEQVYALRDSVLYAAMLDRRFRFHFLPWDADSLRDLLGSEDYWRKALDLRSTGQMFRDPLVSSITLNITVDTNIPYLGDDCVNCRELNTAISLLIVLRTDPEPLALVVNSPQIFVTKPDPLNPSRWVLFRQTDVPTALTDGKSVVVREQPNNFVEELSWGGIKGFFIRRSQ